MDHKFQVNLGGIIDLLSRHIYSSPQVFVRELLQNAVDAITARIHAEPEHKGEVRIELHTPAEGRLPTLFFRDNGVGLTEDEIHHFLATIGQTSKRGGEGADSIDASSPAPPNDFIGQFGIGLLSCFVVSEQITVLTRSTRPGSRTVEWRGRADGTYSIRTPDSSDDIEPGTHVFLACKEGSQQYFEPDMVRELAQRYGSLLPYPIRFTAAGADTTTINEGEPPWKQNFASPDLEREAYLEYGREIFETDFLDYIPLRSNAGDVRGAAFVLPNALSLAARKTHRVYLKNMLLSESAEGLLPEWAFFVKCVVNANDLRPTASRESFYEDDALAATRDSLGRALRNYLLDLAEKDPTRLKRLIALHMLSIKALASADEEFFRIFVKWLPFETNMGVMTLTELRDAHGGGDVIRFALDADVFRQIARVAAAQSLCVVNAGYTYDAGLLLKFRDTFPGARLERVDGDSLSYSFERLTLDEQDEVAAFLSFTEGILRPFNCTVEVRKFSPGDLPALYTAGDEANFRRAIETTKEVTDAFWSSVLDSVGDVREGDDAAAEAGRLCFNYRNPVVYKICRMNDEKLQRLSVQVLYAQSLLLGHRPLSAKEMKLLNEGLLGLVEWGADIIFEGGVQ